MGFVNSEVRIQDSEPTSLSCYQLQLDEILYFSKSASRMREQVSAQTRTYTCR